MCPQGEGGLSLGKLFKAGKRKNLGLSGFIKGTWGTPAEKLGVRREERPGSTIKNKKVQNNANQADPYGRPEGGIASQKKNQRFFMRKK